MQRGRRDAPLLPHVTCWEDPPSDLCRHILRGCTLRVMMRVALTNRHWAIQVGDVLADPWTWAASHSDATSNRLGIPRCPKENAIFTVPEGVASDRETIHAELLDASWSLDLPTGIEAGKELSYLCETETYFGGCTDDASMGIKKAIKKLPNGRPLGLPDELPAVDEEEEELDGEESESYSTSNHWSDDDYSEDEAEERVAARRAARRAEHQAARDARSRARDSRHALIAAGKCRRLQQKDSKRLDRIQTERLAEVLRVLRAATFRMSASEACELLARVILSGVVGIRYCRRADDRSKGPMSFAEVVGSVLASGLRGTTEQWDPVMLAEDVCEPLLFQARLSTYNGFVHSMLAHGGDGESRRIRQIHGPDFSNEERQQGRLLERRRQIQLTHPLWDAHAVLQPLRARGWLCEADEAIAVGIVSWHVAEATRAAVKAAAESTAPSVPKPSEPHGAEDNETDEEEQTLDVGWRESMHWVQYYHAQDTQGDYGVYANLDTSAAARMGRAAAVAKVSLHAVGAMALALAEHEHAILHLEGNCPQCDHEFSVAAFLDEWTKASGFPKEWSPADRAFLIELLSDEPETPRRGYDHRNNGKGEPPPFSEADFEGDIGSWGRYVRYGLDEYLTAPAARCVVSWLRALARESGQLSR